MLVLTAVACTAGVAIATLPTAAGPAGAATARVEPTSDFTGGVRSIDHAAGLVVLVGTGPTGGSVSVTARASTGVDRVARRTLGGERPPEPRAARPPGHLAGQRTGRRRPGRGARTAPTDLGPHDRSLRTHDHARRGRCRPSRAVRDHRRRPTGWCGRVASGGRWHAVLRDRAFGETTSSSPGSSTAPRTGSAATPTTSTGRPTSRRPAPRSRPSGSPSQGVHRGHHPAVRRCLRSGGRPDGHPLEVTTPADTEWSVELRSRRRACTPRLGDDVRRHDQVGATRALVVVPITVSATVEELRAAPCGSREWVSGRHGGPRARGRSTRPR